MALWLKNARPHFTTTRRYTCRLYLNQCQRLYRQYLWYQHPPRQRQQGHQISVYLTRSNTVLIRNSIEEPISLLATMPTPRTRAPAPRHLIPHTKHRMDGKQTTRNIALPLGQHRGEGHRNRKHRECLRHTRHTRHLALQLLSQRERWRIP